MKDILRYADRLGLDAVLAEVAAFAVSSRGRQKIKETEPATELFEVQQAVLRAKELTGIISKNGSPSLSDVAGIGEICLRAAKGGALSMPELIRVGTALKNARSLLAWLPESAAPEIEEMFYPLYKNEGFERLISDNILSETQMADSASAKLADTRKKIMRAEQSIRERLESVVRGSEQKFLQDSIITMRGGRYVVPVRQEHKNDIKGLVHDVSGSGSTYFIEPEAVVEANNAIVSLKGEEAAEIERILYEYSADVSRFAAELEQSYDAFTEIDVCLAKARYAIAHDCIAPEINDEHIIDLKRARHPLIPKGKVVPIDMPVGEHYRLLVVTGPNTGGKTVSLKTVGLLCMMAMAGMMIPAAEGSCVSVFDSILVDIGDEQSIEQSLSTFSGHIKNIIEILKTADGNSLVLLDELGAGTDPAEGAALAAAILERFREIGAITLATTHYGEIKMYALETEGVQNASCEFDVKTLSPTYRITIGVPGRSNAFLISEKLGLEGDIIEDAKRRMSGESRRFESVLSEIEEMKSELADRIREAGLQTEAAKAELALAKEQGQKLKKQAEKELQNAENRARQLVGDVTSGAYKLLDEIRRLDKEKESGRRETAQRAKSIAKSEALKLFDATTGLCGAEPDEYEPLTEVTAGQEVMLMTLGRQAKVLTLPDSAGNLEVAAGNLKMRVNIKSLGRLEAAPKKKQRENVDVDAKTMSAAMPNEINLIGLTTTEAAMETERFISSAVLAHLETVYIIHGKGTGALRAAVQQTLKKLGRQVKSFRLGRYGEGEDGVTVVELK